MKILIVDDDGSIVESVAIALELQWPEVAVVSAPDGEQGLEAFIRESPDLVLLDVTMPCMSGWEMLERLREFADAPVIMVTARGEEMDRVKGLELGADDYLIKPFSHLELFARIKAVLRRTLAAPNNPLPSFATGDLEINFDSHEVHMGGHTVKLTPTEYRLLYLLVRNAGRVLPVETLLSKVWGADYRSETDYLKTYISRLRRKLGDDSEQPRYILTERGVGYRFIRPMPAHVERVPA
jgi:two-component system KDP operon response regulator KdpE